MRNKLLFLLSVIVVIVLAACGSDGDANGESSTSDEGASQERTLKVSAMHPDEHPQTQAVQEYIDTIEEATDGAITFELFPANQLGDYTSVYEEVINGSIDMALLSVPSERDSNTEILGFPHLIDTYDQAKAMFSRDGYVYQLVQGILDEHGVELLGLRALGFGGIGATKEFKDHAVPGADKGVVVRVPQMNSHREYANAMGFNTVSIPYAEIFSSLQTGAVEGVVGSPPSSNYQNFRDVITHYYQYHNSFEASALIINQDLWNELTEDERALFSEHGERFTIEGVEEAEKTDREYLDLMKEEGIEVIEYTPEEIKEIADYIREHAFPLIEEVDPEHLEKALEDTK